MAQVARAFSSVALWLVPLIPVLGAAMAFVLLPDAAALLQPYGLLLLVKLALFAALMGFATYNKVRMLPALARGEPAAGRRFRRFLPGIPEESSGNRWLAKGILCPLSTRKIIWLVKQLQNHAAGSCETRR